jgi:hypothetical protein
MEINPGFLEAQEELGALNPWIEIICRSVKKNPSGHYAIDLLIKNTGKSFAYNISLSAKGCKDSRNLKPFMVPHGEEKGVTLQIMADPTCSDPIEVQAVYYNKLTREFEEAIHILISDEGGEE